MRVNLVVIAKEHVKSMFLWYARRATATASPLAKAACGIARLFENRGHGQFFGAQRSAATIRTDRSVATVFPGHQATASRRTDRRTGQGLGETHSLPRHAVDGRGLNVGMPQTGQLVVTQFVRHDVDNIRALFIRARFNCQRGPDTADAHSRDAQHSPHFILPHTFAESAAQRAVSCNHRHRAQSVLVGPPVPRETWQSSRSLRCFEPT